MQPTLEEALRYYHQAEAGHVWIRETLEKLVECVVQHVGRLHRDRPGERPRILELGSHAGFLTDRLLRSCPRAQIVVWDTDEEMVSLSRQRALGDTVYHTGSLDSLAQAFDIVVSVARHHHLPHDYLPTLAHCLRPGAVYVLADELCPEYCDYPFRERIELAQVIHVAGGYILTTPEEVSAWNERQAIPEQATQLEQLRKRALWRWYRFVVDEAVARGYFDIAVGELKSTHDDLITGSDAEHKFSPLIVERQLALAGFSRLHKHAIGATDNPEHQSMFVYELAI